MAWLRWMLDAVGVVFVVEPVDLAVVDVVGGRSRWTRCQECRREKLW